MWALFALDDGDMWRCSASVATLLIGIALPIAWYAGSYHDPHANVLCLRGHESWIRVDRPPVLVGKVIVPGGTDTEKRWICEEWERRGKRLYSIEGAAT